MCRFSKLCLLSLITVLCAATVGCRDIYTDAEVSVPSITSNETEPSDSRTTDSESVPEQTEPVLLPYFTETAELVRDGISLCRVVYSGNCLTQAQEINAVLSQFGEVDEVCDRDSYGENGVIYLRLEEKSDFWGNATYRVDVTEYGICIRADSVQAMTLICGHLCRSLQDAGKGNGLSLPLDSLLVSDCPIAPLPYGKTAETETDGIFSSRAFTCNGILPSAFDEYRRCLTENGYTEIAHVEKGANRFASFRCSTHALFLDLGSDGILRVTFDPYSADFSYDNSDSVRRTSPYLLTLTRDYKVGNSGAGFVFVLSDGSYVIFDGGTDEASASETEHARLMRLLNQNNTRADGQVVIRAWFLTNGDYCNTTLIQRFAKAYGNRVILENLMVSLLPDAEAQGLLDENGVTDLLRKWKNQVNPILLHVGQTFSIGDFSLAILDTADRAVTLSGVLPEQACAVTMVKTENYGILLTSTLHEQQAASLIGRYGQALKCDMLQIADGGNGGSAPFYALAAPSVVLWQNSTMQQQTVAADEANQAILSSQVTVFTASEGVWKLPIPLTASDKAEALTVSGAQ